MGKTKHQPIISRTEDKTTFFYYAFRNILLVGLPLLVVSGFVLSLSHSSATDGSSGSGSTDSFTVSISSACTISSVVNSEHIIETNVGTYVADVGKTTIKTLCNDGNGYAIYANGYSNNEEGNNKLINSEYPQYSIDTGLATGGLTSTWAMKLNNIENDPSPTPPVIESSYNDTYGLVPTIWTKVAGRTAGTTDMDEGSSFTTTYSVYASSNQHAGSYVGEVKYILLHPSTEPIYPFMQDVANWSNTRLPNVGDSIQAIDQRDGKKYWVTRLADGNVWMTENLDLCIGCTGTAALTSENTDISTTASGSGIYSSGYTESNGVWTWTPANTAITSNHIVSNNKAPGYSNSNTAPYSAEGGDTYFYTSNNDSLDTMYNSIISCATEHTETDCSHYHIGNYYNWTAAIASNNSTSASLQSVNADNSICPAGWRLPKTSTNDFGILLKSQGIIESISSISYATNGFNSIRKAPLYFVRSGLLASDQLYNSRSSGLYSSSTINNSNISYFLSFSKNGVSASDDSQNRFFGFSIRCLARTED